MRERGAWRVRPLAAGLLILLPGMGLAYVNPNFTPLHVEKQSAMICTVVLERFLPQDRGVAWRVVDVLKGKPPGPALTIDFARARADRDGEAVAREVVSLLRSNGSRPAILFGAAPGGEEESLLHVAGAWVRLSAGRAPTSWHLKRIDTSLNTTFSGGTDMLIGTMRFIITLPGVPIMPVAGGVSWDARVRIGKLPGKAAALEVVDVNGDGRLDIYAACPGGDRVFVNQAVKAGATSGVSSLRFSEVPALGAAGLAGAWADFDGDGRPDLASLTRDGLVVRLQTEPGRFAVRRVPLPAWKKASGVVFPAHKTPAISAPRKTTPDPFFPPTVTVIDLHADGRPDLVIGAGRLPVVLKPAAGGGAFQAVALAAEAEDWKTWGRAGPCIAADLDGDGLSDIVQCYEKDGLLFRGSAGGTFSPGRPCGAAMGKATSRRACLGDLDGDGLLDIVLVGGGATPRLLHNRGPEKGVGSRFRRRGDGWRSPRGENDSRPLFSATKPTPSRPRFEEVMQYSGEPGYIVQAGAHCAAVGDFNHDTFLDLFVGYAGEPWQVFFNRGFRSFAVCRSLALEPDDIEGADRGQAAALWADLAADGAQDLVVALANGEVYLCQTTLGAVEEPMGIRVRVGKDLTYAGPVNVRLLFEGRCLGVRTTRRWTAPAMFGFSEPGEYTLRWNVPGLAEQSKKVIVEQGTVEVVIGRSR